MKTSIAALTLSTTALLLTSTPANAASQTWTGGGTSGLWSDSANWNNQPAPGGAFTTNNQDVATFDVAITNGWGAPGTPVLIDAGRNLKTIHFEGASGNYTLGTIDGPALRLTSGGGITLSTNAAVTVNAPLEVWGSQTFSNTSTSGSLTIRSDISNSSNSNIAILLGGSAGTQNILSGVISDNGTARLRLELAGAADWTLTNANTFSGIVQRNGTPTGTLTIAHSLALQNATLSPGSLNNGQLIIADGITELTIGGLSGNSGLYDGKVVGYANLEKLTLNLIEGKTLTAQNAGVIHDNPNSLEVIKTGAGTQNLQGEQLYTGATTIAEGTLGLSGTASLASSVINNNAIFDVSGLDNTFTLQAGQSLRGAGRVIGAMSVGAGSLEIGNSTGTMIFDHNLSFTADSSATFEINGFGAGEYDLALGGDGVQAVSFGGTLNVVFQDGFSTLGSAKIFDFESYVGSFQDIQFDGLASGYQATFDAATGTVTVTGIIPESASAGLITLGSALLWVLCSRPRR